MSSILIILYLSGVLVVGLAYSWKKDRSTEDYFFGGRTTRPLTFGSSLVLSNTLRYQIVLLPLVALESFWVALAASIAVVVLSYRFGSTRGGDRDEPGLWGSRSGRRYVSAVMLLSYVTVQIAGFLVLANLILGEALNLDYSAAVLLMIVFAGIYALVGGFSAVVHAELFQSIVFGVGLLTLAALRLIPSPDHLLPSLVHPDPVGLESAILGLPVMSLWIWHYDRMSLGQIHSAQDSGTLKRGLLVAGGIVVVAAIAVGYSLSAPAAALSPASEQILLIVCFAALMASLAPTFISAAEMMSNEFFREIKPKSSERELVLVGRLTTAVVVGIAILLIPFARSLGPRLLDLFLLVQACLFPPLTAVFVSRLFTGARAIAGVLAALVAGETVGVTRFALLTLGSEPVATHPAASWLVSIDDYLFAFCLFCFSLGVLYGASLVVARWPRAVHRVA